MKAKNGKVVKSVQPVAPGKVLEADQADPGEVAKTKAAQREQKAGKYGETPVKPFSPAESDAQSSSQGLEDPAPQSFTALEVVDEAGQPVAGERYEVTLPDGRVASGTLDQNGSVRIEGIEPGQVQITFPDRDMDAWEKS